MAGLRKAIVERNFPDLPADFVRHLQESGKAKEIAVSPNSLALLVKELREWQNNRAVKEV